jgi:transcriptional regulator with XRE-family HTH domain
MEQQSIGQRINFLMTSSKFSVRKFAQMLDLSETNIRNYIKGTKPSSDVLEKIAQTFPQTNLAWLITGNGQPFLDDAPTTTTHIKNISGGAVHSGTGNQVITLEACMQELELTKRDATSLQKENDSLREQLKLKDQLLEAKDETIALFRSTYNRPN